jgi:FG-GAP-like repeat/FG-GAP repeat
MRDRLASAVLVLAVWTVSACTRPKPVPQARSAAASEPVTVEVGKRPIDLAAGDLDGDGRLDLVCAAPGDRRISVNLQRNYGWTASAPLQLPIEPHLVALADLDQDRHLDVVATAHDSGNVWAWLGDGTGRFSPADGSPFTAFVRDRPHNHGLVVGDVDGDGDPDVVVTDQDGRSASVLLTDGKILRTTPDSPIDLGGQSYPPALGDMDGDGRLDLVAPLVGGNAIALLRGDGRGGFQHVPGSPRPTGLARPYAVALGDLDGNRTLDVVVIHDDTDRITVWLTSDGGKLSPAPDSPLPLGRRVGTRVKLADVDRDGHLDLVAAGSGSAVVARGDGRGGFAPYWAEPAGESWSAIAGDFDGDGRLDLAVPDADADAVRIWLRVSH